MNIQELRDKVIKLNEERKSLVSNEGKAALSQAFVELFGKHPGLKSISWAQYTPYFNDGDACVFSYHGFRSAQVVIGTGEEEEIEDPCYSKDELAQVDATLYTDIQALDSTLEEIEDVLEIVFGDHVEVTANRDGFDVDECNHD